MFDFAKRDAQVARKLCVILDAPVEHKEKIIGKALRALWGLGVAQERERVYTETDLVHAMQRGRLRETDSL